METVRAKMSRLGIIDHVSRLSRKHRYREGWVFSGKLGKSMALLARLVEDQRARAHCAQEQKDGDLL